MWIRYEPVLDSWTGPFLMAGINTRVVRRSNICRATTTDATSPTKEVTTATGPGLGGRARCSSAGRRHHRQHGRIVHRADPCDRFAFPARTRWGAQRKGPGEGGFGSSSAAPLPTGGCSAPR